MPASMELYGSAVMPENDVTLNIGGAIDVTTLVSFTRMLANGTVEVGSSNPADSMNITITGRAPDGTLLTNTLPINGTTFEAVTGTFKRLLKAELSGVALGIITVRKAGAAGDLMIFSAGVTTVRRAFYSVPADVTGGAARSFYEKIFYKNDDGTDALLTSKISLPTDMDGKITFALEAAQGGSDKNGAGNNRLVAPSGYAFTGAEKDVPSDDITPGSAIGIWVKLSLAAGLAASDDQFNLKIKGADA
ncbi:MAG: hypothetical protein JKY45_10445 [Emcibacter sp.]|nr:hypothetical protein [Emcibacter sp.]